MNLGELTNRFQERIAKDREEIARIAHDELQRLQESLRTSSADALHTTEAAIRERNEAVRQSVLTSLSSLEEYAERWRKALTSALFRNLLIGLALAVGIGIGGWGLISAFEWRLESIQTETAQWKSRRDALKNEAAQLERKTWGVILQEDKNGRFILLPPGMKAQPGWTMGNRQALRLE